MEFVGLFIWLVGSVVCCVQLFGEAGYGKGQVMKDMQQRVWKGG